LKDGRIGYNLTEAFDKATAARNPRATVGPNHAYEAAVSAVKASLFLHESTQGLFKPPLLFAFPSIVVDAPLFECFLGEDGKPEVAEINQGWLFLDAKIPNFFGTCIRVVSASALEQFSSEANETRRCLWRLIADDVQRWWQQFRSGQGARQSLPPVQVQILDAFYSRDFNGIGIIGEIHNSTSMDDQVTSLTLELRACNLELRASPYGARFSPGEQWWPATPFDLFHRKMTRGAAFFKAPENWRRPAPDGWQEALPMEPLQGNFVVECLTAGRIERQVEINSISTNRERAGLEPIP
jgi:hypothetical protein